MRITILRSIIHICLDCMHYGVNILFPKNRYKITFISGPDDYVDNSRALSDYILSQQDLSNYKIYWLFKNNYVKFVDKRVHPIYINKKWGKFRYFYHTVTSKYLFSTHGAFVWACPFTQKYLCLWHGTMLKRVAYMQDPVRNKYYMHHCELFASPSKYYNQIVANSFNKRINNVVTTGYPRVDLLFQDSEALNRLNIYKDKLNKIVIYMPTFRQAKNTDHKETNHNVYDNGIISFSNNTDLEQLNKQLASTNLLLIVKPHPSDNNIPKHISLSNIRVIDNMELSNANVQLYQLLRYADALITDFSSVFCDYMVLDKPIGFIVTDIDEYKEGRGFVYDNPIDYMPGEILYNKDELRAFLYNVSISNDTSKEKRKSLKQIYNDFTDGNNCIRVLKAVGIQ